MQKAKTYRDVKFDAVALAEAERKLASVVGQNLKYQMLRVRYKGDEEWDFDTIGEFLAAASQGKTFCQISGKDPGFWLTAACDRDSRIILSVPPGTANGRDKIEEVFSVFEKHSERCRIQESTSPSGKIFIGHGRNLQWRTLKDHLSEKHGYEIEAFEVGSRAGLTVVDVLESMLEESSIAILVMTGEDESADGKLRPRQNVVHEAGLFQGRLGFEKAALLLEEGVEEFSNIAGLQQIRFPKGMIESAFGEVLAYLRREQL